MAWDIVIAGGGFGGYYAARGLERRLPHHAARVTLVNDVNFMLYTPLLPGAAAGTLEPRHVVVPLREQLRRTDLWLGHVTGADPGRNALTVASLDGRSHDLHYDQLIVALGSISRTLPIPGLAEHAVGFKTLSEAIALRNRAVTMLEIAETIHDAEQRAEYLTFMFVGAGYAGLEGIAELQDFVTDVIDLYPRCRVQGVRFVLVEARERVMPEVAPRLAAFAERELRGRGMEIRTNTTVEAVTDRTVTLKGGELIPCRTFAWTAGVKPSPVVSRLGLPLHGRSGRIEVDQTMRVNGHRNVWAIGDAAAVGDPARKGELSPPTAQHAIRQGRRVARNVAAELGASGSVRPFRYKTKGVFVDMGRHQAVASAMGIRLRGFPAWFLARTYHLANMPGWHRKSRLLVDWTVSLLFPRDTSELGQIGNPPELERVGSTNGGDAARAAILDEP
ncbi:NAD(P)/FAD-dependent oxidoreductase [Conexibacter sp. JD483]|uniref:NAD(P)/FAD-dependent oxidoreductase n=1 Tax=unclassified Conexibacter TaxID=2627773 RepID=UPI002721409A|nr:MULTISPECIES: NAD(P)/FAD-dependent oxidoreductase [unclassified Conexibacter]MDO8184795.1 NAD(P)/FAD-dependent oxidoreductase [Conexibacter sp. CPCC 205706]MDO8196570.1 NAD(P)/FAD-dependent oxidoreductase [Conexibacter sp. CPCC 205762]MDR9368717.1 NAD(P)/FAD-dependent oxidoreductase [Conexibacter sp. JD483]